MGDHTGVDKKGVGVGLNCVSRLSLAGDVLHVEVPQFGIHPPVERPFNAPRECSQLYSPSPVELLFASCWEEPSLKADSAALTFVLAFNQAFLIGIQTVLSD